MIVVPDARVKALIGFAKRVGKRGSVVQVSGGIDSAVVLELCSRAFGAARVVGLFLPDEDSSPESLEYAELAAKSAGVELVIRDIGEARRALGFTERAYDTVRKYFPEFSPQTEAFAFNFDLVRSRQLGTAIYELAVGPRNGRADRRARLSSSDLRLLLAHQNTKQRLRMLLAYEVAEERGFVVAGCSNADEIDLGFVVKYGDDAADVYPIIDCSKDEVRNLAAQLGVPQEIIKRPSTTDTFGLEQTQDEYFYAIRPQILRLLLEDESELRDRRLSELGIAPTDIDAFVSIAQSLKWTIRYNSARIRELDYYE